MAAYPGDVEIREPRRGAVGLDRRRDIDPELVLLQAGRDVRVGLRIDVGIDPQRDAGPLSECLRAELDRLQLRRGFDIEEKNTARQGIVDLIDPLADARVNDLSRIRAGQKRSVQFAAGHDVDAAAFADEDPQDCDVGIGLCGETDNVGLAGEGIVKNPEVPFQGIVAVEIKGRTHLLRDGADCEFLTPEFVSMILKIVHELPFLFLY